MRSGLLLTVLVCSGVFTSATAFAKSNTTEEERVCKITYDYANCVVRRRHDLAAEVIVSNYDNGTISNKYARLIDSDCMERVAGAVGVRFPADNYRYALADALVNMDFLTKEPDSFSDRLPLAHPPMPSAAPPSRRLGRATEALESPAFRRIFVSNMAFFLAQAGQGVVRPWLAFQLTDRPFALALARTIDASARTP